MMYSSHNIKYSITRYNNFVSKEASRPKKISIMPKKNIKIGFISKFQCCFREIGVSRAVHRFFMKVLNVSKESFEEDWPYPLQRSGQISSDIISSILDQLPNVSSFISIFNGPISPTLVNYWQNGRWMVKYWPKKRKILMQWGSTWYQGCGELSCKFEFCVCLFIYCDLLSNCNCKLIHFAKIYKIR